MCVCGWMCCALCGVYHSMVVTKQCTGLVQTHVYIYNTYIPAVIITHHNTHHHHYTQTNKQTHTPCNSSANALAVPLATRDARCCGCSSTALSSSCSACWMLLLLMYSTLMEASSCVGVLWVCVLYVYVCMCMCVCVYVHVCMCVCVYDLYADSVCSHV